MGADTTHLFEKAEQYRVNGEYDEAQALYEQILQSAPEFAQAWWGLAHVLMNIGEFDASLEYFRKACDLEPENQRFVYDYAMMLTMLSMFDEAKELFARCVSLDPDSRVAIEARKQLNYL
jgi:tetratricopeptide (TPR) repeat protein